MEEVVRERKIYWMRRVALSKVRDTLLLVQEKGGLKYSDIIQDGIKQGIFLKESGVPFDPTTIYHYRNAALRLGLLVQDRNKCYLPNDSDNLVSELLRLGHFLEPLKEAEKLAFQKLILRNRDCRKAFFWIFLAKEEFDWGEFVAQGFPVFISPIIVRNKKATRTKKYENKAHQVQLALGSPVERMAIEWGLQLWARECCLIDEVYIDESKHILYPVNIATTLKFEDYLRCFLGKYSPSTETEWGFFPIDLVTFELAPLLKVPVEEIQHNFFMEARQRMPEFVKFSSSSRGALVFRSSWGEKTDNKVLKNFLKLDNIWMTHMLVHRNLWEAVSAWKP